MLVAIAASASARPAFADDASPLIPKQLSGFIQVDYLQAADSRDQLNDGNQLSSGAALNAQGQLAGSTGQSSDANALVLNQNRFLLRRARLRLADSYRQGAFAADYALQLDANTIAGAALGLREAELGFTWSPERDAQLVAGAKPAIAPTQPYRGFTLRLGAGLFRTPFGYETYELTHTDRLFAEPSLQANALFPGDFDLGVRLQADYRDMFAIVALQNGEPVGGRAFPARDPNAAKDWFVRLGGKSTPYSKLHIEGAVSFTRGSGFHPGTPPTKESLVWRDYNEDGIAQPAEIQVIRGAAATPSEDFSRWGLGIDLRATIDLPFGKLWLFGEAATAVNLDRGNRPADPVVSGAPQRGVAISGGFVQHLGNHVLLGARADHYDARLDSTDTQGGQLVRANQPFTYFSFAGAYRFLDSDAHRGRARLMVEYDIRRDKLGRDAAGRPADLSDNRLTLRMQLEL